ncbi:hypothetical protein GCM10022626_03480 [[Pseudomonas] carboxydohydrogena]
MTVAVLAKTWIVLVALTIATMSVAASQSRLLPFIVQAGLILAVAGFKASAILNYFLDLRSTSRGWRLLFSIYLVILGGSVLAIHVIGCTLAHGECALLAYGGMR